MKTKNKFLKKYKKHIKLIDENLKTDWKSFHAKDMKKAVDKGDYFSKLAKDNKVKEDSEKRKSEVWFN